MGKRILIGIGKVSARATLLGDDAPRTVDTLWNGLPIDDRTIHVRWSGDAWRTEGNYELTPRGHPIENRAGRLSAGDIIYYPDYGLNLLKIGVAYGSAQWLAPFKAELDVSLIGRIDENLDAFVKTCERIIFDGPMAVHIERM